MDPNTTSGNYSACYTMKETLPTSPEEFLKLLPSLPHTDESIKYWEMMLHCEVAAFPRALPNLPLPSREARFYWHLYSAAAKHLHFYQKDVNHALLATLAKVSRLQMQKRDINISDQLLRLKTFDRIGRKNIINQLERFISKQTNLESICLEGLSLTPSEGIRLILALRNCRKTMTSIYCWRAFENMERSREKIKKHDWFRAIGCFEFLTTLSVNYTHIATPTGDLLINLSKKLGENWHWLQLLCLEETARQVDANCYGEHDEIPDAAWKEARFWAPALKVQYVIIEIPEYDRHKRFFTQSAPTHTFVLSINIDLTFRYPRFLDCTIKTLCSWYSNTLVSQLNKYDFIELSVYLCLQLWYNRENLDSQLRRLLIDLPSLQVLEFIGEIRNLKTICTMCCQIRSNKCSIRRIKMQLQKTECTDADRNRWIKSIKCLMICFKHDFDRLNVKFDISFYPC